MRRFAFVPLVLLLVVATATPAFARSRALDPFFVGPNVGSGPHRVSGYCQDTAEVRLDYANHSAPTIARYKVTPDDEYGHFDMEVPAFAPPLPPGAPYLFDLEYSLVCGGNVISRVPYFATTNVAPAATIPTILTVPSEATPNVRGFTPDGGAAINQYVRLTHGSSIAAPPPFDERSFSRPIVGSGAGEPATFNYDEATYAAYPGFIGAVNVAVGDVDGDGQFEIVTGAGAGGGPNVKVWEFLPGTPNLPACFASFGASVGFYAYDAKFAGGVNVAVADLDGDGRDEIITSPGPGGGPHVRVFDGEGNLRREFMAYDPTFLGGVTVAAADVTGTSRAEIITGAGAGGGPHVRVFDRSGNALSGFYAYAPNFTGGVNVAAGHTTPGPYAHIVTGPGPGGGPHVRVLDVSGNGPDGFYAYGLGATYGVRVAVVP